MTYFVPLFCIFLSLIASTRIFGRGNEDFCSVGNFVLSTSQQPAPLVGFGENIIDRNQVQLFLFADLFLGRREYFSDVIPSILYAVTDDFSLFFNVPIATRFMEDGNHSSGLEDIFLQLEYAIYTGVWSCSTDQVTIVTNASFPSGSSYKNPPTGFGSMAYFIGATYNHTGPKWFCFTSYGVELPTSHHGTKFGNQFLYQFGLGRNFGNVKGWILAWMVEVDGTYFGRNKFHGKIDPDSGGNVIYLTPSLWVSSKDWIIQFGAGYAVQQHLFGDQNRDEYLFVFDLGRTF